ncbi:MAG: hypothetical protein ACHQKZ_02085 [Solirubrobacterales bacterium]|jgi:hypothetical protein
MNVTRRQALIAASLGGGLVAAIHPTGAQAEEQPAMKAAQLSLLTAVGHLKAATPDKGGHRAKALQLVKEAIVEVQKGIEYDQKH